MKRSRLRNKFSAIGQKCFEKNIKNNETFA